MTTTQAVETSVTVNNNNPIQDYVHPDDHTQPTYEMTPGFKPFTFSISIVQQQHQFYLDSTLTYSDIYIKKNLKYREEYRLPIITIEG